MALTKISASVIAANAIVAAGVAENSISTSEIATDGVGTLQISDGAVTSGKLETNVDIAGTLDVTGVLTADSNVVIAGNLTVNGATVTNSSTNTTIADALIELGTGTTGSPANDAGIVIERGDSDNAFIGWDESADTFILGTGSFTGASTGNLTISTAPLSVGTLTASGITFPTSDGSSGQVLKTDGSGNLTFDAQTAVVDNFTATGDGSTTDFDTGINPGDEVNTWVFIDGVYQQKGEYSYSGSTISFSTAPDSGATIDVTTGTVGGFASADSVLGVYETTTTNTDTYTTGISASNENNTWVFVGGVYQPKDSYTFSSGTLTFDANTPTGQKLSVTATKSLSAGSVETNSITANAVTSAKIASNSILSRHIANNSIVGADISATTQITASTFTGALTGDVTGNVVGNLTGTIQTAAQANITSLGTLSALTVSGQLTAGGLSYPTSDGTNEQVLRTDGSGNLSFGTVSGTTLNNNTNNYVMTGTGTANTLNGESGLIFDGTNLGIGASSPDQLLQVGSESYGANAIIKTQVDGSDVGNFDSGLHMRSHDDNFGGSIVLESRSGTNDIVNFKYHNNSSAGATAMAIDATNGNVGIGTDSPNGKLDVVGDIKTSGEYVINSGTTAKWTIGQSSDELYFYSVPSGSERMRIDSAGNVGIGTNNPLTTFQVKVATDKNFMVQNALSSTALKVLDDTGNTYTTGTINAGTLIINQDSGGNVGIGKIPNRSRKLEVAGDINLDNGYGLEWEDGGVGIVGSGATDTMTFAAAGAEVMRCVGGGSAGGSLRVGVTGAVGSSNSKLTVVGSWGAFIKATSYANYAPLGLWQNGGSAGATLTYVTLTNNASAAVGSITSVNNTTYYNTSSDYRLKENVDYTWDATTRLKQLKPARFNWISDETNTLVDGFLAHEVQDIVPEAITGVKDGTETNQNCVLNAAGVQEVKDVTEAEWIAGKLPVLWTENDELPEGVSVGDIREEAAYASDTTWVAEHTQDVYQSIDQAKLVPLLVKTIQELEERITALES
jgi:hypothetical protein